MMVGLAGTVWAGWYLTGSWMDLTCYCVTLCQWCRWCRWCRWCMTRPDQLAWLPVSYLDTLLHSTSPRSENQPQIWPGLSLSLPRISSHPGPPAYLQLLASAGLSAASPVTVPGWRDLAVCWLGDDSFDTTDYPLLCKIVRSRVRLYAPYSWCTNRATTAWGSTDITESSCGDF